MRSGRGSSSTRSCWSRRAITRSPCPPPPCSVGPQGVYAYVVKADNTVEMRPIKVSAANAGGPMALIESGVSAGDQVVVDGQLKLRPGVSVKATSATPLRGIPQRRPRPPQRPRRPCGAPQRRRPPQ